MSYNGKAIYNPKGKAGEYGKWACNFYTGCSNQCDYCYCRKGVMGHLWKPTPQLKKCFKNEKDALTIFEKEAKANLDDLRNDGLFFTFTSDPFLEGTYHLTLNAVERCNKLDIPVIILTKSCVNAYVYEFLNRQGRIVFGHTLTGHDELEPNASLNAQRIANMRYWHEAGFKTWASIEPIIDFVSSLNMINKTRGFCDLFKVGLMSGKKYNASDAKMFVEYLMQYKESKFYIKKSLRDLTGYNDTSSDNFVNQDYKLFNRLNKEIEK